MPDRDGAESSVARTTSVFAGQWWLLLVTTAIALVAAGALLVGTTESSTAEAEVTVRTAVALRESILLPEQAVPLAVSDDFAEQVAGEVDVTADEYLDGANVFATGSTQQHIHIAFTSEDRDEAAEVAEAAALLLVDEARATASQEIARTQELIVLTEEMVDYTADLDPAAFSNDAERGAYEQERRVYDLNTKLVTYKDTLDTLESVYVYNGSTTTTTLSVVDQVWRPLVGALLAGLFVGAVLVWLRGSRAS